MVTGQLPSRQAAFPAETGDAKLRGFHSLARAFWRSRSGWGRGCSSSSIVGGGGVVGRWLGAQQRFERLELVSDVGHGRGLFSRLSLVGLWNQLYVLESADGDPLLRKRTQLLTTCKPDLIQELSERINFFLGFLELFVPFFLFGLERFQS